MIGKLCHEKGLAHLGRSYEQIGPGVDQAVDDRRSALVHVLIKVVHGNGGQICRVIEPLHLPQHFIQIFLQGIVFGTILCYTRRRFL